MTRKTGHAEAHPRRREWPFSAFGTLYAEPSRNGIYKTASFHGHGTRIVNMGELFGLERISNQEMSRVGLTNREFLDFSLREGDLLFGRRSVVPSGAGKCSFVEAAREAITFESSIIRVRLGTRETWPEFYFYFFASPVGRAAISEIVSGTNVKGIRASELGTIHVPVPALAEQKAISEALSDVDTLIESLEQLLAKKRAIKQGAMQELLTGKRRLPGFSGEWETVTMRQVLTQSATYGIVTAGAFVQNGTKMVRGGDIVAGGVVGDLPMVSKEKAGEYERTTLIAGDVVIALVGYPGASAKIPEELVGANISRAVGLLRSNKRIFPDYLACFLNSPIGRRMVLAPSAGSAQQVVNLQALNKLEFRLPSTGEQRVLADFFSDLEIELASLDQLLLKARLVKQGMMQELLTGRIRLI